MAVFNGAFPILAGQEEEGRKFAASCMGERSDGFQALQSMSGVTRETWAMQETPMGSVMIVWFECPDVEKAFVDLATADNEFTRWFLDQVKSLTGVDLGAPPEEAPPEILVDWPA